MNYIKHLTGFFEKVAIDKTLNPTHISLYMSLFQFWNCNRFKNPISISRDEIMRISKISSKATYHKCLKNLHSLGYISYEPSYNPFKGSHVILFNFSDDLKPQLKSDRKLNTEPLIEPVSEQALNKSCTSDETSTEQAVVPYINNTNSINNLNDKNVSNLEKQAKKFIAKNKTFSENDFFKTEKIKEEKSSVKKEEKEMPDEKLEGKRNTPDPAFADYNAKQTETSQQKSSAKKEMFSTFADSNKNQTEKGRQKDESCHTELVEVLRNQSSKPTIEKVKTYFLENNFPELEAQKFFNYFSSVGWLVGGKTPMVDWQAAAQNWILNSVNFNHNTDTTPSHRAKHLNTGTDKNYSEPL
ncbi:transcriptional regulator [Flavobacterium sp. ARAG 55.4]|uniref:transcriptional regulator n=1 Tax=Flavobacterium sp. ARAG 55.4 TaxID=3451357 RepID=UPI003F467515